MLTIASVIVFDLCSPSERNNTWANHTD